MISTDFSFFEMAFLQKFFKFFETYRMHSIIKEDRHL